MVGSACGGKTLRPAPAKSVPPSTDSASRQVSTYEDMVDRFRDDGHSVKYPVEVYEADTLTHEGNDLTKVACK
jgi:hypothetical protein